IIDTTDGAVIHDHRSGPGAGTVETTYLLGAPSFIDYKGMEMVASDPDADQTFIQTLAHQFLRRDVSRAERTPWVQLLQATGGNRLYIANLFYHSLEARTRLVKDWYNRYLGREALRGEEQGWVRLLLAGNSEEIVLSSFFNQLEYFQRAGFRNDLF